MLSKQGLIIYMLMVLSTQPSQILRQFKKYKNHPFTDGNKRSGAFLFVDFLHRNGRLLNSQGDMIINNTGLAALTLLVAESNPDQKETLIKLIINMLALDEG